MKRSYMHLVFKKIFLISTLCIFKISTSQVEFRSMENPGTLYYDVNSNGTGVLLNSYYSYETNSFFPFESEATEVDAINDNGDVAGSMYYDEPNNILQPAYKKNGVWNPIGWFPGANPYEGIFTTFAISSNSTFVVGQMSKECCTTGAFLYNTETETLMEVYDPNGESLAGYAINNQGIIGGWVNQPNGLGTIRVPAYITPDNVIHTIPEGQLPTQTDINAINYINDNNVMVGEIDNAPFIYDLDSDTFTQFDLPSGTIAAGFTKISDNGIAVGFAEVSFQVREAIIYHPDLGPEPIFLKDLLEDEFGIITNTFDGHLGTAYTISTDGNYIGGYENGFPIFSKGWIVYFDDLLLLESQCEIICPDDIEVTAEFGSTGSAVEYELNFSCNGTPPSGIEMVLLNGIASGEEFPIGTTPVFYQLLDEQGNILDACAFTVTVNDSYCNLNYDTATEPITRVNFAGIDNTTTADPAAPMHEYFFNIMGSVNQNETYESILEGNTLGNYLNYFTILVDWDQDGVFNNQNEMYNAGSIANSNGSDGIQAISSINVPHDAKLGTTRLRVVKNYDESITDPCGNYSYGQTEDYLLEINKQILSIESNQILNASVYPNPVKSVFNIETSKKIKNVEIYNILGQEVSLPQLSQSQIDASSLANGIYFVKIKSTNSSQILRIIKE